jgi:S-adenosylmethionine-diacylglycerol 3-amino-3-carboxypropyl transferase
MVTTKTRPPATKRLLRATQNMVFHHVHGGQLIYNACWEDPRIDRQLLELKSDSRVVMITSAGCNALDYLLDGPGEIHAVDVNSRQNALLELKLTLINRRNFEDLFEFFGIGSHERYKSVYKSLRSELSGPARDYWDKNISFFDPGSLKKSFYYHGAAGVAAWLMGGVLFRAKPNIKNHALCLLDADSLAQQASIYARLEPKIWSKLSRWLIRQRIIMTLLGVPEPQIKLIENHYPGGVTAYVKDKLHHVMSDVPARENYFWRVYITGSYTLSCCPNYLREENLALLAARTGQIRLHTSTISQFLQRNPGEYSHYVLLDHQDWLAHHAPEALAEEWALILANSRPGTRILMRSAGLDLNFVPENVRARLRFFPERTGPLHRTDRVGTYGSMHFAEVL